MKKWQKIIMWLGLVITVVLIGSGIGLQQQMYQPSSHARAALVSNNSVTVKETKDALIFSPKTTTTKPAILFYQGAFVAEASYSLWAKDLAEAGYPVYLIHQPLNLAVLDGNKVRELISTYQLNNYVFGGHSLGGVMMGRQAKEEHNGKLKGVFFLASYPDEKGSLANSQLPVLSLTGSADGVLNWENYEASRKFLPKTTEYLEISGGNHAGFGSYGSQKGDKQGSLTNSQQQEEVSRVLQAWLAELSQVKQ